MSAADRSKHPYDHLTIRVSAGWHLRERCVAALQWLMATMPFIAKALRAAGRALLFAGELERVDRRMRACHRLLDGGDAAPQRFGSSYGYATELEEFRTVLDYHAQVRSAAFRGSRSESEALYRHAISLLGGLLRSGQVPVVVNFGVSYAHLDSELARAFPQVRFVGIDRSRYTKLYNDFQFNHLPNLEFVSGDVMELLAQRRFDGGVFLHVRTMLLLPNAFINRLYQAVRRAGFRYVVSLEQVGISRRTFRAYEFSDADQPSAYFRGAMFLHNYPGLMRRAGFMVRASELVRTNHPHEDLRMLSIIAEQEPPA